jgi:hypothetical protein
LFELYDVVPYLFTINIICSFAYVYFAHLYVGESECWDSDPLAWAPVINVPERLILRDEIPNWLSRKVKRKDAPDDDDTDCTSSFVNLYPNKRGGLSWRRTMDSFSQDVIY